MVCVWCQWLWGVGLGLWRGEGLSTPIILENNGRELDCVFPIQFYIPTLASFHYEMRVLRHRARTKCNQGPICQTDMCTVYSDKLRATYNKVSLAQFVPWQRYFPVLLICQSHRVWPYYFSSKICFTTWCPDGEFSACEYCPWPDITAQTNSLSPFPQICHSWSFSCVFETQDHPFHKIPL